MKYLHTREAILDRAKSLLRKHPHSAFREIVEMLEASENEIKEDDADLFSTIASR
jgi:hypothetical protein